MSKNRGDGLSDDGSGCGRPLYVSEILKLGVGAGAAYALPLLLLKRRRLSAEQLRSAAALAVFASSYGTLKSLVLHAKPSGTVRWFVDGLSAAGAALLGVYVDPSFSSSLFVIGCSYKVFAPLWTPDLKKHPNYPVVLLSIATAQAVVAGYKKEDLHHPSYSQFLNTWVTAAGTTTDAWRYPPAGPNKTLSHGIHPGQSLLRFMLTRALPSTLSQSAKLYAPLYLVWALFKLPKINVGQMVGNWVRSTLFLAGYVSYLWLGVLLHSKLIPGRRLQRWLAYTWIWGAALFVLIERKSRQLELAQFVFIHALNSLYRGYKIRYQLRPRTWVGALILAATAARLFHTAQHSRPGFIARWFNARKTEDEAKRNE